MNYLKFILLAFTVISSGSFIFKSNSENPCTILKNGTFKYLDSDDSTAYFVVKKSKHEEYYSNGMYFIKSKLKWKNDCEYTMKMLKCTVPNFPFKPKDILHVKITQVKGDTVFYRCQINSVYWTGRLLKLN